jgi:hypothetical protein
LLVGGEEKDLAITTGSMMLTLLEERVPKGMRWPW